MGPLQSVQPLGPPPQHFQSQGAAPQGSPPLRPSPQRALRQRLSREDPSPRGPQAPSRRFISSIHILVQMLLVTIFFLQKYEFM
ncbi:unnamed protein product [Rotaria sordida]|uniref:Uncharacterized protein n=1 Tax=Rotaria sordida TaxID=392033 RepID=A0A819MNI1_9BILA|nr:unnamed protein product [Rotaria sordida]CAF1050348.1 unnamed protein product [Rotaria sordida]CAF1133691.1 unnamed protein product [Rotaria sordida]CAF1363682.1 unnamed protein product [Rotaria sordida]CAF3657111.1 unnamed protein product [Rotaria sordida]